MSNQRTRHLQKSHVSCVFPQVAMEQQGGLIYIIIYIYTQLPPKKGVLVPLQSRVAGHTLANVTEFFDFIIGELKIKNREILLHMFLAAA